MSDNKSLKIKQLLPIHSKLMLAGWDLDTELSILEYKEDPLVLERLENKIKNIETILEEIKKSVK